MARGQRDFGGMRDTVWGFAPTHPLARPPLPWQWCPIVQPQALRHDTELLFTQTPPFFYGDRVWSILLSPLPLCLFRRRRRLLMLLRW